MESPNPELRLTVVQTVYYQQPGTDIVEINNSFSQSIKTDEQAYRRVRFIRNGEVHQLETGWLQSTSKILIQNLHGTDAKTVLSPEETEEVTKHVLLFGFKDSCYRLEIPAGHSLMISLKDISGAVIESRYGIIKYSCAAFPE